MNENDILFWSLLVTIIVVVIVIIYFIGSKIKERKGDRGFSRGYKMNNENEMVDRCCYCSGGISTSEMRVTAQRIVCGYCNFIGYAHFRCFTAKLNPMNGTVNLLTCPQCGKRQGDKS